MKRCKLCGEEKSIDDFYFYRSKNYRDGICKSCRNQKTKNWRRSKLNTEFYKRENLLKEGSNICHVCEEIKPLSAFYKSNHVNTGYINTCKNCKKLNDKNNKLKYSYGIDLDKYNELLQQQNGRCAICKIEFTTHKFQIVVDHNHSTNQVKGLLCHTCNRGLGLLKDNIQVLYSAIRYLKRVQNKSDELLETPEEGNQQPSSLNGIKVNEKVQRLENEEPLQ
jgi:hypothetical protein